MLSALIQSIHSYSAVHLATQLIHQRYVQPGPLVLESELLKYPAPTTDRDRTVSRRSEPSSRATLIRLTRRSGWKQEHSDPVVPHGRAIAQRIKGTPGITG